MTKKYSINVKDDQVVAVEVDGIKYKSYDLIPDPDDRARMMLIAESFSDMDFSVQDGKPSQLQKIIIPIFLAVTVLMLVITAISAVYTVRAIAKEESARGIVVDLKARKDESGQEFYYPVVEFLLPDQSRQTLEVSEGSWPPAYKNGDWVTVAYDPQQPLNARIKSTSSTLGMWTLPIITGVLGGAFFIATVFAYWLLKPTPKQKQPQ